MVCDEPVAGGDGAPCSGNPDCNEGLACGRYVVDGRWVLAEICVPESHCMAWGKATHTDGSDIWIHCPAGENEQCNIDEEGYPSHCDSGLDCM